MSAPLVSVLLPVFNAETTLAATLESLLQQTFTQFEIIAVNDGSTDGTTQILRKFALQDARVRPLQLVHGGIVAALNAGMMAAQGKYIARMDADDLCLPERLEKQVAFLEKHPSIGLVGCAVSFGGDRKSNGGYARYVDWTNSLTTPEEIALERFRESPFAHPSVMFRQDLIHAYGGYRAGEFPEDYELWLRWLENDVRMAKLPEPLLIWNDPPNRLSRTASQYDVSNFYTMKTEYLARWILQQTSVSPEIYVIGGGKMSRRRALLLQEYGIRIAAWIDIDPKKIGNIVNNIPVCSREALPPPQKGFCLAYLAGHGAAEELETFLKTINYVKGRDFLLAS